jgi:hypothetical protein
MIARSHRASIPVKGTDTRLIPGQDPVDTAERDNGHVQALTTKGKIMNNNARVNKTTAAGVVSLTLAGIAATIVLANDTAADTTDFRVVEEQQSAPIYNYTGPRTADAVEAWLNSSTAYIGPKTADAAEVWIESGAEYTGPRTADAAEHWFAARRDG